MKILVIDDDDLIRASLQTLLECHGHEVITAADGREGVRLAEAGPDFIFCDISMPEMDGFAVIQAIRKSEKCRLTPFVFITGNTDRADQRRGMALGADDYVTKPFTTKDLLDVLAARTHRQKPLVERVNELATQRRRQMSADWSHELLTPLNGMLGGLQLLEMEIDTMSREEMKEMIAIIRSGVERQEKLSRKLIRYFDVERIKEGSRPAFGARSNVAVAVREAVSRALAGSPRAADLEVKCEPGEISVIHDHLVDAVAELVDNALSFSAPGTPVLVAGTRAAPDYRIEVTDQGPGMSPEERASIAAFAQFGRSRREQQGLGLGLAIAQSVARIAGGKMVLEDGLGGKGLKATLVLPLG